MLNPLVSIVTLYRDALYYQQMPSLTIFLYAIGSAAALLLLGLFTFYRLEPAFAEEV